MSFNPIEQSGIPLEKQFKNWSQMNVTPVDKNQVHPYTRTRIILMNGIEVEGALFSHQFARHCPDMQLKKDLALTRRLEQQQQKMVNWLLPGDSSPLETTLGYEQVAVDLTAALSKAESDENVKAALDFALIEDFDHLYRYSNLYELTEGKDPGKIVGDYTEIMPGRTTIAEHCHPFDTLRSPYKSGQADFATKLHVLTIIAAEQQTMNFYMNIGPVFTDQMGRGLYQEIGTIEEQHVSHYESLADPAQTWLTRLLLHEYNECFLYKSCLDSETDENVKKIWQFNLECEIEHLHRAMELYEQYEKKDARQMLPESMPESIVFKSNKDYVRQMIERQSDFTAEGSTYRPVSELAQDSRYFQHQKAVNVDGSAPSQDVIGRHIQDKGTDYRLETEGPHPVERFRSREMVAV